MASGQASDANYDFMWDEYKKALDRNKALEENSIEIYPEPGFVVRIPCEVEGVDNELAVCLNMCQSPHVLPPTETQQPNGEVRVRLPLSCGPMREETDGRGNKCIAFDVVFNPQVVTRCLSEGEFKEYVSSFAFQNVQRRFPVTTAGKFSYPSIRFVGVRPAKQRIRKTIKPKVEVVGEESSAKVAAEEAKSGPEPSALPSNLFQAKMPEVKPRQPPMSPQEAALLEQFRKQMPDLKREELRKAMQMYQRKAIEEDRKAEEKKRKLEEESKIPEFTTPKHSVYCRCQSGSKLKLANFLGRVYVKAAFEHKGSEEKHPSELIVYIQVPALGPEKIELVEAQISKDSLVVVEKDSPETKDAKTRTRSKYRLDISLPFPVNASAAIIRLNAKARRVSLRVPVERVEATGADWRKKLVFKNPFIFKFVS